MSTGAPTTGRTLSTAEARRESVLVAAQRLCADKGLYGTPTLAIAKEAGISQAYLFRLFPTKDDLAEALVQRCNEQIYSSFASAAARARAEGRDPLEAMGDAYVELIADRDVLLVQLHSHAAAITHPAIRDAMRESFRRLHRLVVDETAATDEQVQAFFATGMLCNVMGALDAYELDEPWARTLGKHDDPGCSTDPAG